MSLAEQLKRLQIPGQSSSQQFSTKKVSILFDVQTAASLDNEAVLNIGMNGFKEMKSIDRVFMQFDTLFCKNALYIQRNMNNKSFNQKIQEKISDYLTVLTPYVLLRPAQKTLEWLIRRFQVHILDKDALMACILPYHETQIFSRIVQLFGNVEVGDMWDWLLPCQKEGVGFSTKTLINQCVVNRNLLSFICKMADKAADVIQQNPKSGLKIIFSFHAQTLTAVIDAVLSINEEFLSFLLPFIHNGLKSQTKDYVCSCYMALTFICSKVTLKKDIIKAVLGAVIKVYSDSLFLLRADSHDIFLIKKFACNFCSAQYFRSRTFHDKKRVLYLHLLF